MTQKMTLLLSLLAIIGSLSNADISVKNKLNQVSLQNYVREPSEWKYRVVYQLLTDRFSHGENDPTTECVDLRGWCGGTFTGIKSKLDYLEHLGIDAIWISPMVKNTYLGYHGYWAENIYEVEPHFGSKDELIDLITECHKRDIWVMLDVVPNHMGYPPDCFWDECNEPEDFSELFPFDKKDYYHNLCMIKDFDNQTEVELCRLASLPDLNQENEEVKNILYNWVSELTDVYQFDGYRIDTARHISKDFWPGFEEAAGTYVIGEISVDEDHVEYLADYQNVMSGVLNFPTYYSLRRVFAEGFPMNYLYENILEQRKHYKDVKLTGTFVDNHDQNRFLNLTNQNLGKLKNSLAFILFGDGIPIIYSGTELEFHGGYDPNNRESLWPHFDEEGEVFQFISQSNRFRKSYLNVVVDSQQNEIYIDDKTYIFEKGNFSLIVAVTSAEKDEGSYSLILSDLPINDLTQFCNVYTNETLQVIDGSLNLTFTSNLDPMVLYRI